MKPLRVRSPTSVETRPTPPSPAPRTPVPVLDRTAWTARAFYFDILALAALVFSALALGLDLYAAGYASSWSGERPTNPSFRLVVRLGFEMIAFAVSFAWLAARLLRAGYRELPGSK